LVLGSSPAGPTINHKEHSCPPNQAIVNNGVKAGMTVVTIGIAILIISTVGAILWVKRSESGKQRQVKVLLFALYLWLLVFAQLIFVAVGYSVLTG
jgi:hypothetical protein